MNHFAWIARALCSATKLGVYALSSVVILALLAVTLPALFGLHAVTVYGGSMGKALPAGSVAVTRPVDAGALRAGDIIAIGKQTGAVPTLHRIVSIERTGSQSVLITRGDANATNDPGAIAVDGQGDRVVYHVPFIGYILAFTRTEAGMLLLMLPGFVWILRELREMWFAFAAPPAAA